MPSGFSMSRIRLFSARLDSTKLNRESHGSPRPRDEVIDLR